MHLLVFGASGGCGSEVVRQALERGHDVTAVVRPPSPYRPPAPAAVKTGDVSDAAFVKSAVDGHDVVISCLGLRRATMLPWSRLLSPPTLVQTFTRHLLEATRTPTVRRIIWISAAGVADSIGQTTAPIRALIRAGNLGRAYDDLAKAEALVPAEDPRWLAVRPVTLMNGPPTGWATSTTRYGLFSIIRRADVAAWMLDVADASHPHEGRTVLLGTRRP